MDMILVILYLEEVIHKLQKKPKNNVGEEGRVKEDVKEGAVVVSAGEVINNIKAMYPLPHHCK